jgi:hypothetical protein
MGPTHIPSWQWRKRTVEAANGMGPRAESSEMIKALSSLANPPVAANLAWWSEGNRLPHRFQPSEQF